MSIFKRAAEEELDLTDEEMEEEESEGKFRRRKIKDLKPENKKKRKEPVKPWTRKERYLVLSVLIGSVLASFLLFVSAREWKLPGLPKIALPDFGTRTIIITKNEDDADRAEAIIADFKTKTKSLSGNYSFSYIRLDDGLAFGVGEKEVGQAASFIKLPVLATLYQAAEAGKINLDEKYTLKAEDKRSGSGSLYGKPVGTVLTYREMARLMGHESDNTAFNIVRKKFGDAKIDEVAKQIEMENTSIFENETTTADIAVFFKKLWKGEIVSSKSRDEILGYLTGTIYETMLPAGIPDVKVAHKYGAELHVINDGGIILSEKPFVLVIMTKGIIEKEAVVAIPSLVKLIYEGQKTN